MGIKVNFKGVGNNKPIIAEGVPARLTNQKSGTTAKKDPKIRLEFTIMEGEHEGRKIFRTYTLTEEAYWAIKKDAITLGGDEEVWDSEIVVEEEIAKLMGAECLLDLDEREYEDNNDGGKLKTTQDVSAVRSAAAGALFR